MVSISSRKIKISTGQFLCFHRNIQLRQKKLNNIELLSIETSPELLLRIKGLGVHFKMMAIWTKNVVYGLSLFMISWLDTIVEVERMNAEYVEPGN